MKTPDTDLHTLIQALTRTERRYLRLHADETATYWQLFEAISGQKKYDEAAIKQTKAPFTKHLAEQKQYLMDWLLDQLSRYQDDAPAQETARQLAQVRQLIRYDLKAAAQKRLHRVLRQATQLELYERQLEALHLLRQLASPAQLSELFEQESVCIKRLQQLHNYLIINNKVNDIQRKFQQSPDAEHRTSLTNLIADALLTQPPVDDGFLPQMYFWQTLATAHFTLGNAQSAQDANLASLQLFEADAPRIVQHPERYLSILQNYLIDTFTLRQYDALASGLERLRAVPEQAAFSDLAGLEARVFRQRMQLEINWRLREGEFVEAAALLPDLEQGLAAFKLQIARPQRLTFAYLGAYILWGNRDWSHTLDWLQPILQETREDVVVEVFHFTRLLQLICHFELGDFKLLESLIPSTRRHWHRQGLHFASENAVVAFINAAMKAFNRAEVRVLRTQLAAQLESLRTEPAEQRLFQYVDLMRWIK